MAAATDSLPRVEASEVREEVHRKVDALADAELEVVGNFLDAMASDVVASYNSESWLTSQWLGAFLARLRAHHALSIDPLSTTQFEAAFNNACTAAGWQADPASSATHRFFDTTVSVPGQEPRHISLKASAAQDMRREWIHISKLTEAAWIQDARTIAARRAQLVTLFSQYRRSTTSIVMLRAFRGGADEVLYELVEIPRTIFASVDQLTAQQAQAGTIPLPPGQSPPDLKIRLDRSDAKVTLTGIRLGISTVHAHWHIARHAGGVLE